MPKLIITRGLSGSGKTTFAKAWTTESEKRARVNRDDIRMYQLGGQGVLDFQGEQLVTDIQQNTVRKYLRFGYDVIVDDTNLRLKYARAWADLAMECQASFEVRDFDTSVEECVKRDAARGHAGERWVGSEVILSQHQKFMGKNKFPKVKPTEKDVVETQRYVPDTSKPKAWIFDIDGTLADMHPERSPYDWAKVGMDGVHEPVRAILWALQHQAVFAPTDDPRHWEMEEPPAILVVSGRDDRCRPETEKWLADHDIQYTSLHMRPEGDNRKDTLVKGEIFWNDLAPRYHILGSFDDRQMVVDFWRSIGLKTFQCEPGAF